MIDDFFAVDAQIMLWTERYNEHAKGTILSKDLLSDSETGMSVRLVRYPAGLINPSHTHPCGHGMYVLEGTLVTHKGEFAAGSFVWFPEGKVMFHGATAQDDVTVVFITNKPFEIHYTTETRGSEDGHHTPARMGARSGESAVGGPDVLSIPIDRKFEFDVQGYLHLRQALTREEVAEYLSWCDQAEKLDLAALNADNPEGMKHHLNRPVSRMIDANPRFARLLDHPAVERYLVEFLGADYRHIDNDLYYTHPGYAGGHWHRGVRAHPSGHMVQGQFICPMVKVFYCLTDVGPDEGEFVVVPGSHHSQFLIDTDRVDLPGQHVFNDVRAGDVIIFNEALLHNGRPNPSRKTRKTLIVNFGRSDAGVWPGYTPWPATLDAATPRQRDILTNSQPVWKEPTL